MAKETNDTPTPPSDPNAAALAAMRVVESHQARPGNDNTSAAVLRPDGSKINPKQELIWGAIRQHTERIGFNHFADFVELALCEKDHGAALTNALKERRPSTVGGRPNSCKAVSPFGAYIPGVDLYGVLKLASEMFLLLHCGICPPPTVPPSHGNRPPVLPDTPDDAFAIGGASEVSADDLATKLSAFLGSDRASYINGIIDNVFGSAGFKVSPFCPVSVGFGPCLMELIWSYWHEEGMLGQTTSAIALRFQNVARNGRDPLTELELDPLRPLSGFIWGYIQDESTRLSVARRSYEYQHQYGLGLSGKAAGRLRPADSRSTFLQAFHDLLRLTDQFYREAADTMVRPDPFPLLIALRDLHMILAEGAHNQFRDLPWTARSEMLVQQWLLARSETRDFLRGRLMVPYPEGWMGAVDAMKRLQGWSDTNIVHFHNLATFGERILLSIRHVRWDAITDPLAAQDWALFWRGEIQGYVHAYRLVTGVTLCDDIVELNRPDSPRYRQPAALLRARLLQQRRNPALSGGDGMSVPSVPARMRYLPRR